MQTASFSIEVVGLLITVVLLIVGLVIFFIRMENRQEKIIALLERIAADAERNAEASQREHEALMTASHDAERRHNEQHDKMIEIMQGIKEPLIEAVAVLKSHVAEERKR